MNPTIVNPAFLFLNGAACMGALSCGLFFLNFWRKSADRLFLVFAISFWLLAIERIISLYFQDIPAEDKAALYLLRLVAFLVILAGIWDKNRKRSAGRDLSK